MRGRELAEMDADGKPIKRAKTSHAVEEFEPQ
jgi:hypothetical protein